MEHPIEKIGDHITFSTYKLSSSNLFVFGMNHARSSDSDYKEVELRILNLVENNPGLVILKEGVIVDEDNIPKDELGRRIFLALKHKIAGMKVLANTKQGQMQERLFGNLEGKGIKVLKADANLSTLVEELKSSGIDPEYLEDSLTYKVGLSGDINLEDLTKRSPLSEEDRALNKKIEDQVFISMRNEIAAKKVREQLEQGSDCILLYGNEHIPGIISNIFN